MQARTDAGPKWLWGWIDWAVALVRPDRSPVPALLLLVVALGPVVAYCIGGIPHVGRIALAAADVVNYHLVVNRLLAGVVPYSPTLHGHIPFIYPPGLFALILLPVVGGGHYVLAFAAEMLALVLIGTTWLSQSGRRIFDHPARIGWPILALLAAAGPLTLLRPDPVIGLLLAGSVVAWRLRHRTFAFVLIALAGLIKDYGWVASIPMLALQLGEVNGVALGVGARVLRVLRSALPALVLLVVIAAVFIVWSHGGLIHSQLLNVSRGVEIESLAGGLLLILSRGRNVDVFRGELGNRLLGGPGLHTSLAVVLLICLGAAVTGIVVWRAYHRQIGAGGAVAAVVAAALIATPVFSPQYIEALLPCLVLAAAELEYRQRGRLLCLGLGVALLTQLEFPYLWDSVVALHPHGLAVLELRNLLLLGCIAGLLGWRPLSSEAPSKSGIFQPLS